MHRRRPGSRPARSLAGLLPLPFLALLLSLLAPGCGPEAPDPLEGVEPAFTFGVMGDLPYSARSERRFPRVVASLEARAPAFVIHVGDVKAGGTPCTDSLLLARKEALAAIDLPMVYLPGDNDWTDCHRNGGHAPLERLASLRALFYPEVGSSTVGGRPMAVERQSDDTTWVDFPEHQRWRRHGVVFATVHVVGSLNALAPFDARTPEDDAAVDHRIEASVAWIEDAFRQAREVESPAVVIAFHGNPWEASRSGDRTGFEEVLATLAREARSFGEPVLLVHGDTHTFRVDRPLLDPEGDTVANVTRLETYGEPDVGWVEVGVDPDGERMFVVAGRPVG